MPELSVSFFVKFGLRKLSQFTLTYFLPTALDIQKLIRQFTVLEKGATQKHHNDFTETPLFIFFSWIWTVQSFFVKVVRCTWDISNTESTLLFVFSHILILKINGLDPKINSGHMKSVPLFMWIFYFSKFSNE